MVKIKEEEINSALATCKEDIERLYEDFYKDNPEYEKKEEIVAVVLPISDEGFIILLKIKEKIAGSIVMIGDCGYFSAYGEMLH